MMTRTYTGAVSYFITINWNVERAPSIKGRNVSLDPTNPNTDLAHLSRDSLDKRFHEVDHSL